MSHRLIALALAVAVGMTAHAHATLGPFGQSNTSCTLDWRARQWVCHTTYPNASATVVYDQHRQAVSAIFYSR